MNSYQEALDHLSDDLKRMGNLAREGLAKAVRSLAEREPLLADEVVASEIAIDELEIEVDRKAVEVLFRYQPVAADLRRVVSAMKVSGDLERIGDEAVNIAKYANRLNRHPELEEAKLVAPVYQLAAGLLDESLDSFWHGGVSEAMEVKEEDKKLNRVCKKAGKIFTRRIVDNPELAKDLVNLMFVIRSLRAGW